MAGFKAVICGASFAAVEGLLRLRKLAGAAADVDLVAPNDDLVVRPLAVRQPFAFGAPARYPIERIAADAEANWIQDTVAWVDADARTIATAGGAELGYDALLIAVGGRQVPAFEHVRTFRDDEADETYQGVVQDIEGGYVKHIAFLLPEGPVWPLPLYELALMSAERAYDSNMDDLRFSLVTPDASPMAIFGRAASDAVSDALAQAGVEVHASAVARVEGARRVRLEPDGTELEPDSIIAMPSIHGPGIRGVPGQDEHGFIPIDAACRVPGTDGRIHAAGDAAAYPIKHGGLGAEMADSAASSIASLAGVGVEPQPFHPVIRGKLLGGRKPLYLSARLIGAQGFESEVFERPPWPEDEKVVAEELGPYLARLAA